MSLHPYPFPQLCCCGSAAWLCPALHDPTDSLRPHVLQHTSPPCPSTSPEIYPSSCPLHWWCHWTSPFSTYYVFIFRQGGRWLAHSWARLLIRGEPPSLSLDVGWRDWAEGPTVPMSRWSFRRRAAYISILDPLPFGIQPPCQCSYAKRMLLQEVSLTWDHHAVRKPNAVKYTSQHAWHRHAH